jgi:hypothetical protein
VEQAIRQQVRAEEVTAGACGPRIVILSEAKDPVA